MITPPPAVGAWQKRNIYESIADMSELPTRSLSVVFLFSLPLLNRAVLSVRLRGVATQVAFPAAGACLHVFQPFGTALRWRLPSMAMTGD